jgi:hypothetical protein
VPNKEFVLLYAGTFEAQSVLGQIPLSFEESEYPYSALVTFFPQFQ